MLPPVEPCPKTSFSKPVGGLLAYRPTHNGGCSPSVYATELPLTLPVMPVLRTRGSLDREPRTLHSIWPSSSHRAMIRSAFHHRGLIKAERCPIPERCDLFEDEPLSSRATGRSHEHSKFCHPVRDWRRLGRSFGVVPIARHASFLVCSSLASAACRATPGDFCSSTFKDQQMSASPRAEPRTLRVVIEGSPRCHNGARFIR